MLLKEGYVANVLVEGAVKKVLRITLRYHENRSAVTNLKQVSRPGLRRYVGSKSIPRVLGGLGIAIMSTPKGVLTGTEARKDNAGGELLCYVW